MVWLADVNTHFSSSPKPHRTILPVISAIYNIYRHKSLSSRCQNLKSFSGYEHSASWTCSINFNLQIFVCFLRKYSTTREAWSSELNIAVFQRPCVYASEMEPRMPSVDSSELQLNIGETQWMVTKWCFQIWDVSQMYYRCIETLMKLSGALIIDHREKDTNNTNSVNPHPDHYTNTLTSWYPLARHNSSEACLHWCCGLQKRVSRSWPAPMKLTWTLPLQRSSRRSL